MNPYRVTNQPVGPGDIFVDLYDTDGVRIGKETEAVFERHQFKAEIPTDRRAQVGRADLRVHAQVLMVIHPPRVMFVDVGDIYIVTIPCEYEVTS